MLIYFHEMTEEEFKLHLKFQPHITWEEAAKLFPQPTWCNYPEAVCGEMGCWSLMCHYVTGEKYCEKCDCYKFKKTKKQPVHPAKEGE